MSRNKHQPAILILNQMAGPMTWELAVELGREFGQVALLTGHPDTLEKDDKHVQLFKGFTYDRESLIRRIVSWIIYWLQALIWLGRWNRNIPIVLFSNPPFLCWVGWIMLCLRGQRYTVMVHDIYPDVIVRLGYMKEQSYLIKVWRSLNRHAYERAQIVMTLGDYMAKNLTQYFDPNKTNSRSVKVIHPWVDTEFIKPIPKHDNWFAHRHDQVDKLTVMYSGNMGFGHDIETLLEAARNLNDIKDIHFILIGSGPKWYWAKDFLNIEQLCNVTLLPWQPEDTLPYQLSTADIGIVTLENEMWDLAIPSKLLYMMAAGTAIIALTPKPSDVSSIVEESNTGKVVRPGDIERLTITLKEMKRNKDELRKMSSLARSLVTGKFSKSSNYNKFYRYLLNNFYYI